MIESQKHMRLSQKKKKKKFNSVRDSLQVLWKNDKIWWVSKIIQTKALLTKSDTVIHQKK